MREYWPVILALVVAAAVIGFALTVALERKPAAEAPALAADHAPGPEATTDPRTGFYQKLEELQPRYVTVEYACPVDGTKFKVQSLTCDNRFGGVATDLMALTLAPPETAHDRPSLEQQAWEALPATCPTCGATLMDIDFRNMKSGLVPNAEYALRSFKLAEPAPALAAVPQEQWTADQRLFARYLTTKAAGFPAYELGYYALAAAYGANFSYWSGAPRRAAAPSAAYYALAAACYKQELDDPAGTISPPERPPVLMTQGEMYRLLGRAQDAAASFARAAEEYGALRQIYAEEKKAAEALAAGGQPGGEKAKAAAMMIGRIDQELKILDYLQSLLDQGDFTLHRVEDIGLPDPPVGWYLDEMLPQINGYIAEHRTAWAVLDDPLAIARRIDETFAGTSAPAGGTPSGSTAPGAE